MSHRVFLLLFTFVILSASSLGQAEDRSDLGKVLQSIPPNGPFSEYGTVVMGRKSKKAGMAPAIFPHWSHRTKYTCRVCHLELEISMRSGDTGISRQQYLQGKYCGACHDGKTAFTVQDGPNQQCGRCHLSDTKPLEERFKRMANSLPNANFGNGINWSVALRDGTISPKNSILSSGTTMQLPEKLLGPMKLSTPSPRTTVTFSHEEHFAEIDCSLCHPDIFNIKKKGTQSFSMSANIFGNFCGACHMRVAFPMNDCQRCHPQMSYRQPH